MTDLLRIAPELSLPLNAVTQTFGFIARKGAGKTYACGKLVELLHGAGARFIVLDIVGNWGPGLRLAADGKKPGIQVPIFGGDHADVPIDVDSAAQLARVLVKQSQSAVIDVSLMRKGERVEFVTHFAEELFFAKKQDKRPLLVVLEEAHKFAPQMSKGQERMLGAIEDIVRLGRNYGLGAALVSQRPQSISKEVLNQVECLFVGQLNGAHERDAIRDWVKTQEAANAAKTLDLLPTLEPGRMVCWSPQWLRFFGVVSIAKKWTFDASATPELGAESERVRLDAFDVGALAAALAGETDGSSRPKRGKRGKAAEREDDGEQASPGGYPAQMAELRGQMAELERRLQAAQEGALPAATVERLETAARTLHETGIAAVEAARDVMAALPALPGTREPTMLPLPLRRIPILNSDAEIEAHLARTKPAAALSSQSVVHRDAKPAKSNGKAVAPLIPNVPMPAEPRQTLDRRILTILAQHRGEGMTRDRLALHLGVHPNTKSFTNMVSALRGSGYVEGLQITTAGQVVLGTVRPLPTGKALLEWWCTNKLAPAEVRILRAVASRDTWVRDSLADHLGVHPNTKSLGNTLSKLRGLGLVNGLTLVRELR